MGAQLKVLPKVARAGWAKSWAAFSGNEAKEADGRGLPGTQVMTDYLEGVDATGYEWPHSYELN